MSADFESVLRRIVDGKEPGESSSDVLLMVHMASGYFSRSREDGWQSFALVLRGIGNFSENRSKATYVAGVLLCPIFEPVKHEMVLSYVANMTAVRRSYAGISADVQLQAKFADRLDKAASEGLFQSITLATFQNLPKYLSRGTPI